MAKATKFDAADYLESREDIAAYLSEAFETADQSLIAKALGTVVRAKGIGAIADQIDLTRQGLGKSLGPDGNPEFATVMKVMDALGLQLTARPKAA